MVVERYTRKRYASSTDVARHAGVSQSTVSRTFRGDVKVLPETRAKVLESARELDYRPNLLPRIMLTQQSRLVALVMGGMNNPFYARVLEKFTTRLQNMNCQVMLAHVDSYEALDDVVPRLSGYRVDAVVSSLSVLTEAAADQLIELGVPIITFNSHLRKDGLYTISCDNVMAGREVARHLIDQGAKRLAYLGGQVSNPANVDRRRGFAEQARELGFEPLLSNDEFSVEGGRRQAETVFALPNPPDAVFCGDDLIAIGAIDALWRSGKLSPPPTLRMVGFDDIPQASWAPYDLSSIQQDETAMVQTAIGLLQDLYSDKQLPGQEETLIAGKMVIRNSSRGGVQIPRRIED